MIWVLGIWALVLITHAVKLFGINGLIGPDWEARKTQELMRCDEDH